MSDTDNKQVLAKLNIIEQMASEVSVKQLCQVLQDYIKAQNKSQLGFTSTSDKDEKQ